MAQHSPPACSGSVAVPVPVTAQPQHSGLCSHPFCSFQGMSPFPSDRRGGITEGSHRLRAGQRPWEGCAQAWEHGKTQIKGAELLYPPFLSLFFLSIRFLLILPWVLLRQQSRDWWQKGGSTQIQQPFRTSCPPALSPLLSPAQLPVLCSQRCVSRCWGCDRHSEFRLLVLFLALSPKAEKWLLWLIQNYPALNAY